MKKLISLASAMILVFATVFSGTALAAFTDVDSSSKYAEAITTLSKFNIINGYDDGSFKPEGLITRGEFTKIITYALGLSELKTEPKEFSDISDHWARYNIKTAYDKKIINGFTDGTFRPNDNVTYEQALKMVVCTLGYGDMAENQGGYPIGYHGQAAALRLTDEISGVAYTDAAPRGVIAQMVFNALEVYMKELSGDGVNWVATNKTLLNDYLYVKKFEGEMTGAEDYVTSNCIGVLPVGQMQVVSLSNPSNYITMDFTEYTQNITDITKHLGKEITVYYRQRSLSDEPVLVVIDDETASNEEYTIKYKDIVSISNGIIRYYPDETSAAKSLRFEIDEISVRYNGKSVDKTAGTKLRNKNYTSNDNEFTGVYSFEDALYAWLDPDSEYFIYGDVVLTDRGGDGKVDDIQINDYQTIVALRSPSTSDYRIADKLKTGNSITLNPEEIKYSFTIIKDNKQINTTNISSNDVLLYAESLDKKLYTVHVTNNKVTGKITSMSTSDGTIDINNITYTVGSQCENYIRQKQDGKQFSTGQEVTLYTDKFGSLVFGEIATEQALPYAYIVNAYEDMGAEVCYITAYCPSKSTSKTETLPLKSKLFVDGRSMSATAAIEKLEETARNNNKDITSGTAPKYSQLVKIEVNSDGEVSKIITVAAETASTNEDADKIVRCKEIDDYSYSSSSFLMNNKTQFSMNASTLIIYVPANRAKDGFAKKTTSSFTAGEKYKIEAYDISSSKYAGVVLMYGIDGTMTKVTKSTYYSVVSQKPVAFYNEADDEITKKFSVYSNNTKEKEWVCADETEFENLVVGDVILFGYDQNSKANSKEECIFYSDIKEMLDGKMTTITTTDENGEEVEKDLSYHWAIGADSTSGWKDNWRNTKYDYRFMENGKVVGYTYYGLEYTYSRAAMFNVSQIVTEENEAKLYVTTSGFDGNELYNTEDYETISMKNIKILRVAEDGKSVSPYVEGTETALSVENLKDAQNFGKDCSKILVIYNAHTPKMIVIYE